MSSEAVVVLMGVPSHHPGPDANYAYGDWVWIGPPNLAQKVVEHLESLPDSMLRLALDNRAYLRVIDASEFTPAEIRSVKDRIMHRLTKGPFVSECDDGEPCIYVPVRNGGKWPVQEPLPSTPFAWYVVQKSVSEAERVWSIVAGEAPNTTFPKPVLSGSNAAKLLNALLGHNATCPERLVPTKNAVEKISEHATPNDYKKIVTFLKNNGYVKTARSRHGGVWLTQAGIDRAQQLKSDAGPAR